MNCIIKNIPPPTFGIAGNRGIGFPLVNYCSALPQPVIADESCYLVKEEDGTTFILGDLPTLREDISRIEVSCTSPILTSAPPSVPDGPILWTWAERERGASLVDIQWTQTETLAPRSKTWFATDCVSDIVWKWSLRKQGASEIDVTWKQSKSTEAYPETWNQAHCVSDITWKWGSLKQGLSYTDIPWKQSKSTGLYSETWNQAHCTPTITWTWSARKKGFSYNDIVWGETKSTSVYPETWNQAHCE